MIYDEILKQHTTRYFKAKFKNLMLFLKLKF